MNQLYPIFLKPEQLSFLIIGGGNVGLEKLTNLFRSSPTAKVRLVAPEIQEEIVKMQQQFNLTLLNQKFDKSLIKENEIVVIATSRKALNLKLYKAVKEKGCIVNVADTPGLCDFYMGSIVTKGHLKIAISTNGKSPTVAKRLREWLTMVIPENINNMIETLNTYRNTLKGDFEYKVNELDRITKKLLE